MTPPRIASTPLRGKPFPPFVVEDRGYETPCHIWQGATNSKGYPIRLWESRSELVHRFVCIEAHGDLAAGDHAHHLCEERMCVNSEHIAPVSVVRHNREHVAHTAGAIGDSVERFMADGAVWSPRRLRGQMTWASHQAIQRMLTRAVKRGEVERVGRGAYRLRQRPGAGMGAAA